MEYVIGGSFLSALWCYMYKLDTDKVVRTHEITPHYATVKSLHAALNANPNKEIRYCTFEGCILSPADLPFFVQSSPNNLDRIVQQKALIPGSQPLVAYSRLVFNEVSTWTNFSTGWLRTSKLVGSTIGANMCVIADSTSQVQLPRHITYPMRFVSMSSLCSSTNSFNSSLNGILSGELIHGQSAVIQGLCMGTTLSVAARVTLDEAGNIHAHVPLGEPFLLTYRSMEQIKMNAIMLQRNWKIAASVSLAICVCALGIDYWKTRGERRVYLHIRYSASEFAAAFRRKFS